MIHSGLQDLQVSESVGCHPCRSKKGESLILPFLFPCACLLSITFPHHIGMLPDFALLLVGANMGVQLMTKEHISIACALQIPLAVVLTKVDIAPQVSR